MYVMMIGQSLQQGTEIPLQKRETFYVSFISVYDRKK